MRGLIRTNDSGNVIGKAEYSAYGLLTVIEGDMATPFLYNGQAGVQTDSNGLLNMRARYYSPYLMRFLNADPIGFNGGSNWFAYADGNPISGLDPLGLAKVKITTTGEYDFVAENPSPGSIRIFLGFVGDAKIKEFTVDGHGYSQGIQVNDQTKEGIDVNIGISAAGAAIANPQWTDTGMDISIDLNGHIDGNTKIRFDGCNTANDRSYFFGSANNLSKSVSETFPSAEVTGLRGYGWFSNPITGNANHVGGITRTYKSNGVK